MNKKMIAGLVALLAGAGAGQAGAATYAATSDAFVYQFLGNLSAPGPFYTPGIGVWNHENTHGTRGLIDFNSIDSALSSLSSLISLASPTASLAAFWSFTALPIRL